MRTTVWLLNVDHYAPRLTALTYPLIRYYADRIGARLHIITERKYPDWPVTYEKLQIYDLAREDGADWNIYIDSDAAIHPECVDYTEHLRKDTVMHNGADMANIRWSYDRYFRRDGRQIGSCNWFTMASDWCLDLWAPLDLSLKDALAQIHPTMEEQRRGITAEHLIDDFALSRNIARYGLKFTTVTDLHPRIGLPDAAFFWHNFFLTEDEKVAAITALLGPPPDDTTPTWNLPAWVRSYGT